MGDVEADGAAAVRDGRMAGEKRLRRSAAAMMGNAIGLPATVLPLCDAAAICASQGGVANRTTSRSKYGTKKPKKATVG